MDMMKIQIQFMSFMVIFGMVIQNYLIKMKLIKLQKLHLVNYMKKHYQKKNIVNHKDIIIYHYGKMIGIKGSMLLNKYNENLKNFINNLLFIVKQIINSGILSIICITKYKYVIYKISR